jgi:hypothetical protein
MVTFAITAELKLETLPRALRARCRAVTRLGKPCQAQALKTGFCYLHSQLDTAIPMSSEAKERQRENGRRVMAHLWATRWKDGRPLSDEGRERIRAAQRRRSAESRYPSEETRQAISDGRRRFEAGKVRNG